jgi:hypothetical protein
MYCEKMAVTDMLFRQRASIEFLMKEENSAEIIYERLRSVCVDMPAWVPAVGETFEGRKHGHRLPASLWSTENYCN